MSNAELKPIKMLRANKFYVMFPTPIAAIVDGDEFYEYEIKIKFTVSVAKRTKEARIAGIASLKIKNCLWDSVSVGIESSSFFYEFCFLNSSFSLFSDIY